MSERAPCCCVCAMSACLHGGPHVFCYRHTEQRLLYASAYIQQTPNAGFTLWTREGPQAEALTKMVEEHRRLPWYRHLFCLWC